MALSRASGGTQTGSASSLTVASVTLAAGDRVIVCTSSKSATVTGITWNGNALTRDDNSDFSYVYSYYSSGGGTGDVVVSFSASDKCACAVIILSGSASASAVDQQAAANGTSGSPSSGATGTTAQADEYVQYFIYTNGPSGDTAGTWTSGTAGQRAGTTGGSQTSNATVAEASEIVSATGTFTAAKTGMTSRFYRAMVVTYKAAATGTTYNQSVSGGITPTGTLGHRGQKALGGPTTPTGSLSKQPAHSLAGASTPTGVAAKQAQHRLTGATTPTGVVAGSKTALKAVGGTTTPTGALVRKALKALAGASTPTGVAAKQAQHRLAGSSAPTGTVAGAKTALKALAGSTTPTGTVAKRTSRALAGALGLAGVLLKRAQRLLAGSTAPTGDVAGVKGSAPSITYTDSRLAIMRLGAARLGTFTPTAMLKIAGTSRETDVMKSSLQLVFDVNAPATAVFTVVSGAAPSVGQEVVVSLGEPTNRLFGGSITRVTKTYLVDNPTDAANIVYTCECQDYSWLLSKRAAYGTFSREGDQSYNSRAIAEQLVREFGDGTFAVNHIDNCLDVSQFDSGWDTLADALRSLASELGAIFYVDPYKGVHLAVLDRAPNPHPLAAADRDFREVSYVEDLSQTRTFVIALGGSISATADCGGPGDGGAIEQLIPVSSVVDLDDLGLLYVAHTRRIISYSGTGLTGGIDPLIGGKSTTTAPAAAGATTLSVAELSVFPQNVIVPGGWVRVGSQVIRYASTSAASGAGTLNGILATGHGSITDAIASGEEVVVEPYITVPAGSANLIESGDELQLYAVQDDAGAEAALAALEGGDGIRQIKVDGGGALGYSALLNRATAELAKVNETLVRLTYKTRDPNALPGRFVTAAIVGNYAVAATFRIARVTIRDINFNAPTGPLTLPWREVEASTEQTSVFDLFGRVLGQKKK